MRMNDVACALLMVTTAVADTCKMDTKFELIVDRIELYNFLNASG